MTTNTTNAPVAPVAKRRPFDKEKPITVKAKSWFGTNNNGFDRQWRAKLTISKLLQGDVYFLRSRINRGNYLELNKNDVQEGETMQLIMS